MALVVSLFQEVISFCCKNAIARRPKRISQIIVGAAAQPSRALFDRRFTTIKTAVSLPACPSFSIQRCRRCEAARYPTRWRHNRSNSLAKARLPYPKLHQTGRRKAVPTVFRRVSESSTSRTFTNSTTWSEVASRLNDRSSPTDSKALAPIP